MWSPAAAVLLSAQQSSWFGLGDEGSKLSQNGIITEPQQNTRINVFFFNFDQLENADH